LAKPCRHVSFLTVEQKWKLVESKQKIKYQLVGQKIIELNQECSIFKVLFVRQGLNKKMSERKYTHQ